MLLQRAEDLRLEVQRQIADLVEEQRPAVRQLELAQLLPVGASEGAALVSEQLALHQVGGNGWEVHGDERTGPPVAPGVDVARQHFLAGAALTGHQHGDGLGGDLLRHLHHRAHPRRGPQHHGPADVRGLDVVQPLQLAARAELGQRLSYPGDQFGRGEVLGNVIEGAGVHRLHRDCDVLQHRAHDHADIGMALPHDPQRFQAAHPRHLHVEQHQIEGGGAHALQRLLARGSHRRLPRSCV